MERFYIEVDGINYLVNANLEGSYSLIVKGITVFELRPLRTQTYEFNWESVSGLKNQLIDRIGRAIENRI